VKGCYTTQQRPAAGNREYWSVREEEREKRDGKGQNHLWTSRLAGKEVLSGEGGLIRSPKKNNSSVPRERVLAG